MAITATFKADFSSFLQAIDKAEVALVDMSKGASKVETSLNRMVDNFSGRKLIQEATLMTIAVEKAGGVAALTEKQLASVGATAAEAAEKMRRLGYEVPAGIQKIADAAKNASTENRGLSDSVKSLVTGFAALFTARAAFNFVDDIIKDASALQDLSNRTHINVEEIQRLAGAMSEFGVDAETLGKGLFGLSRRIAAGDDSVAKALETMGLSLEDVRGMKGEELFLTIEHGLSKLQGGLRDTTASELFGSRLGEAMAGASEGIDDALDAAHRLNTVMSTESVEALDRYGESIERAQRSLTAMAANMIGPVAEGFNTLISAAERGAPKWDIFVAMLKDFAATNTLTGASTENLATLLDHLNQETEKNVVTTAKSTEAHVAHAGAVQVSSSENRQLLADVKNLNEAWAASDKILSDFTIKTHKLAMDAMRDETKEREHQLQETNKSVVDGYTQIQKLTQENTDYVLKQTMSETDFKILKIHEWEDATIASFKGTAQQLEAYTNAVRQAAANQIGALTQVNQVISEQERLLNQLALDAVTTFAVIGTGTNASLLRPDTQGGIQAGPVGGSATSPGFVMPGFSLPPFSLSARAGGGPVSAGRTYMVGERGPELFRPSSSGVIDSGKGGATVYNTFNIVDTEANIVRRVSDQITRSIKTSTKWGAA